jgi:Protein of unknown function (DUF1566)
MTLKFLKFLLFFGILSLAQAFPALAQTARYTYSTEANTGVPQVLDNRTGLVWRRCAEGQTWNGKTCSGVALMLTLEGALSRAKTQVTTSKAAWRLPNVKELASLLLLSRSYPATNMTAFPGAPSELFWSSTPNTDGGLAQVVYFTTGAVGSWPNTNTYAVRLVRDNQ